MSQRIASAALTDLNDHVHRQLAPRRVRQPDRAPAQLGWRLLAPLLMAAGALALLGAGCSGGAGAEAGKGGSAPSAETAERAAAAATSDAASDSTSSHRERLWDAGASSAQPGARAAAGASVAAPSAAASGGAAGPTMAGNGASPGSEAIAGTGTSPTTGMDAAGASAAQASASQVHCAQSAPTDMQARLHIHHIHFNTQDPDGAIAFVQKYFEAKPVDYCKDEQTGQVTRAAKTERAYFLYSKVDAPPSNMRLNRLAHVGYINPDVTGELKRLLALDVPLADASVCATAAMGTPCNTFNVQWFYVDTPESARFEIATGPGPAPSGFGHIHLVAPDYSFFQKVLGEALEDPNGTPHVDMVNMVASGRTGVLDESITYEDTRGAAVDHVGFSTGDLEGTRARIEAAGISIEEPISLKPEYGFRSFMVRSSEGIWLEILEADAFAP